VRMRSKVSSAKRKIFMSKDGRIFAGIMNWLKAAPSRVMRPERYIRLGIKTHYWDGGAPVSHDLKDISMTGAYLCTAERWYWGTILTLTLVQEGLNAGEKPVSISLPCRVVRHGPDGIGVQFIFRTKPERKDFERFLRSAMANRGLTFSLDSEGKGLKPY